MEDIIIEKSKEEPRLHTGNSQPKVPLAICELYEWIGTFITALILVITVFTLLFKFVTVDGTSMNDTLQDRDYLVITDINYTPKTGDIVVIQVPYYEDDEPLIKRVIATSGQEVRINFNTWQVWVDDKLLEEPYIKKVPGTMNRGTANINNMETFTVKEGCVFVMGDNRNNSLDSRYEEIGQIDERYIMGKAVFRLLPVDSFGKIS